MGMTVLNVLDIPGMAGDTTRICIRTGDSLIASGNWFSDNILRYKDEEVLAMEYRREQDELTIYTD